jgi:ElaB/YqjD/DUF883 family membrane-anchored ribosome-binding protein
MASEAFKATAQFKEAASTLRSDARDLGALAPQAAREQWDAALEQGRRKTKEIGGRVEEFVMERPFKSLLIAAGVGMFVGYMCRRR